MGVTNYYSVGGQLLGECTNGVETTFMSDAQGSTIGTVTTAGLRNRYIYNPYGSLLSKTGIDANPKYMYNGKSQSRTTGCAYAEQYNRRRHVSTTTAQWTTRDKLWPSQRPYGYAGTSPASRNDPSGLDDDGGPIGRHLRFGTELIIGRGSGWSFPRHQWLSIPMISWPDDALQAAPGRCLYVSSGSDGSPTAPPWTGGGSGLSPYQAAPQRIAPVRKPRPPKPPRYGQNYDWDPLGLTFGYGNCCGLARRCTGNPILDEPVDCVDAACSQHDACLGGGFEYVVLQGLCDLQLCLNLAETLVNGCCDHTTKDRDDCMHATLWIMALYCPLGFGITGGQL